MSDKKSTVGLLINSETRCVLDFNGAESIAFMEVMMMIMRNQGRHMLDCDDCQENYGMTPAMVTEMIRFTENLLDMRGCNASNNEVH